MYYLHFDIRSFWHAGSSRGKGQALDALVHKEPSGVPSLPGRTVKGLARDALRRAEHWGRIPEGLTGFLFGIDPKETGRNRHESEPGCLAFGDARLPEDLIAWVSRDAALRQGFFQEIHATAIDPETGCAGEGSLRGMEVTIPLSLKAPLQVLPQDRAELEGRYPLWPDHVRSCLPLIRGLGVARTRGLGRCVVSLEEVKP